MTTTNDPLDNLAAQAAALDASTATDDSNTENIDPIPSLSNEQAIAGAIAAGREAFCFFTKLESPRAILTDDTVQQLGTLWAPVANKHGFNLGDYLGDYAIEIAAIIGTISIAAQLRNAVSAEMTKQTREAMQGKSASDTAANFDDAQA